MSWTPFAQIGSPRQIAILAGTGHCVDLAIPMRLRRRAARSVLSIRPVIEDPAQVQAAPGDAFSDYLVVFQRPL